MNIRITITALALLLMPLTACQSYRAPSLSGDPAKMSADTLCFRYASSKDPKLAEEIAARNLDCTTLLRDDPLMSHHNEIDRAHRIGR